MKKVLIWIVAALFISSPLLFSCTKGNTDEAEKGAIDRMTEKVGKEMADRITDPIDKARNAKELTEKHNRDIKEDEESERE